MPCFTCVTSNRGHTHVSQHTEDSPAHALKQHISEIPFYEGINPIGDELYWLQSFALGKHTLTLERVKNCENTWTWEEGKNYSPAYLTFIVCTDTSKK